jgi:hypothetical protein
MATFVLRAPLRFTEAEVSPAFPAATASDRLPSAKLRGHDRIRQSRDGSGRTA